jgi:hypothetical protein
MAYFNLSPDRVVGMIKLEIREAILDGKIQNNLTEATNLMAEIGARLGLKKHES